MIKKIGTIGFYIRFNEPVIPVLKFFEVFSSSAATTSLFSASTNSSGDVLTFGNSASYYLNGSINTKAYTNEWQQMVFTFPTKLETLSDNNFIVRFGNTQNANFNIQNIFILDKTLYDVDVLYIYNDFTSNLKIINAGDKTTKSMTFIDRNERLHSSSFNGIIYQPLNNQKKFKFDVQIATDINLSAFTPSRLTVNATNNVYDGYILQPNDYILCIPDGNVYQYVGNSLTIITIDVGDYFNVLNGIRYGDKCFTKTASSFEEVPILKKIKSYLVTDAIE